MRELCGSARINIMSDFKRGTYGSVVPRVLFRLFFAVGKDHKCNYIQDCGIRYHYRLAFLLGLHEHLDASQGIVMP